MRKTIETGQLPAAYSGWSHDIGHMKVDTMEHHGGMEHAWGRTTETSEDED